MCRTLWSGICFFKLLAPVTTRWLNGSFTLSVEVVKILCILGRGTGCAREGASFPRRGALQPSPAERGHLPGADGNAQQVQGYFAPLTAGWEGAGTFSCLLCNGNQRQGHTRGTI